MSNKNSAQYLPHTEESDLKRQDSYYESLKKRENKKRDEKIAEYSERQERIRERLAVIQQKKSPLAS